MSDLDVIILTLRHRREDGLITFAIRITKACFTGSTAWSASNRLNQIALNLARINVESRLCQSMHQRIG